MIVSFNSFMCNTTNPRRMEFLQHSRCVRENVFAVDGVIPCLNQYLLGFEYIDTRFREHQQTTIDGSFNSSSKALRLSEYLGIICCAHERKRQCTKRIATDACGARTAELFDEFFENIHFG